MQKLHPGDATRAVHAAQARAHTTDGAMHGVQHMHTPRAAWDPSVHLSAPTTWQSHQKQEADLLLLLLCQQC